MSTPKENVGQLVAREDSPTNTSPASLEPEFLKDFIQLQREQLAIRQEETT